MYATDHAGSTQSSYLLHRPDADVPFITCVVYWASGFSYLIGSVVFCFGEVQVPPPRPWDNGVLQSISKINALNFKNRHNFSNIISTDYTHIELKTAANFLSKYEMIF